MTIFVKFELKSRKIWTKIIRNGDFSNFIWACGAKVFNIKPISINIYF